MTTAAQKQQKAAPLLRHNAGKSANPLGAGTEAARLRRRMLLDTQKIYHQKGRQCLERLADDNPKDFLTFCMSMLPKQQLADTASDFATALEAAAKGLAEGAVTAALQGSTTPDPRVIEGERIPDVP